MENYQNSNDNKNETQMTRILFENISKVTERLNKYIRKNKEQEVIIKQLKKQIEQLDGAMTKQ